jgi:hypothetical protein
MMKTNTPLVLHAATLLGLIMISGCSQKEKLLTVQATPTPVAVVPGVPALPTTVGVGPIAGVSYADQASAAWASIKDLTYDQRTAFASGGAQLEAMLSQEVEQLKAKRATMTGDTGNWDFAMKEVYDSQMYLKSMIDEAVRTTPEFWSQEKDKVDQAWIRTQEAFDKVKVTTTS